MNSSLPPLPTPAHSALLTDLSELTMLQAYHAGGMNDTAVFEFFVRDLPPGRNFLLVAGLAQVIDYLTHCRQRCAAWSLPHPTQ